VSIYDLNPILHQTLSFIHNDKYAVMLHSPTTDFWYTQLDCPNYTVIQNEISAWLTPQLEYFKQRKMYFENLDPNAVFVSSPSLLQWLQSLSAGPVRVIGLIINEPNSQGGIHTDTQHCDLALNISIQTAGTHTNMYSIQHGIPYIATTPTGLTLTKYDKCVFDLHSQFQLENSPVIMNTKKLHNGVNPTDQWRLAISIRFKEDPWHIINK
jgi:hypothetical protein